MRSSEPAAMFDTLSIGVALTASVEGPTRHDIHVFAYLSCLLSLFRGRPVADWGYSFASTRVGAPFSLAVSDAIDALLRGRLLTSKGPLLLATEAGQSELALWRQLRANQRRCEYVDAACKGSLALPLPIIDESVKREPGLRASAGQESPQPLLDDVGLVGLHEHFNALTEVAGADSQLFTISTLWLTYLGRESGVLTIETQ